MHFSINTDELNDWLAPVIVCATTGTLKEYVDQYRVTLQYDGGVLSALANGGHVAICANLNVRVRAGQLERITLDARDLAHTIKGFPKHTPVDVEVGGDNGTHLSIAIPGTQQFQVLPGSARLVEIPALPGAMSQGINMYLSEFLAASKVCPAVGWEQYRPEFLYWWLRTRCDGYRSVCGDGARFMVIEREARDLVRAKTAHDLRFHKHQIPPLLKMMRLLDAEEITISLPGDKFGSIITAGETSVFLLAYDASVQTYNELPFVDRTSNYRIVTRLSDWRPAVEGILATYTAQLKKENWIHSARLTFDIPNRVVRLEANGEARAAYTIPIQDVAVKGNLPLVFDLHAVSSYLKDMVSFGTERQYIQMELIDGHNPVVVRYMDEGVIQTPTWTTNEQVVERERQLIFFSAFNKK